LRKKEGARPGKHRKKEGGVWGTKILLEQVIGRSEEDFFNKKNICTRQ